jgi:hypothetical protein
MLARIGAFVASLAIVGAGCGPKTSPSDCNDVPVRTSLVEELQASRGLLHDRLELNAPLDEQHYSVFLMEQELRRELSTARAMLSQARTSDLAFDHCTMADWVNRPTEVHPLCIAPLSSLNELEAELSRVRALRDRYFALRAQNWRRDWSMIALDIQSAREASPVSGAPPACVAVVSARSAGAFDAEAMVTFVIDRRDEGTLRVRPLAVQLLAMSRLP